MIILVHDKDIKVNYNTHCLKNLVKSKKVMEDPFNNYSPTQKKKVERLEKLIKEDSKDNALYFNQENQSSQCHNHNSLKNANIILTNRRMHRLLKKRRKLELPSERNFTLIVTFTENLKKLITSPQSSKDYYSEKKSSLSKHFNRVRIKTLSAFPLKRLNKKEESVAMVPQLKVTMGNEKLVFSISDIKFI